MFVKARLMTPGPTQVAEATRLLMATCHPHHRSAAFTRLFVRMLGRLKWLWDTSGEVLFVTGSGTAGMEAAMQGALRPGDRLLAVTGGKFAERWVELGRQLGCEVTTLDVAYGASATPEALGSLLAAQPAFDALVLVASETSTGALHPVAQLIAQFRLKAPMAIVLVDGITAVGCVDLSMERDGIDLLVSGTQKSFGVPPGGAMVGIGPRGWQALERPGGHHAMSLDLRGERKQATAGDSAFTPAVPLILALDEVMERWHEAGRDALFAHQAALSAGTIAAVKALGLSLFADHPSPALTSIVAPAGIRADDLIATMRDCYGVTITGGQDSLKGKILRIGHLGAVDAIDIVATVTALECALADHGFAVSPGAAAAAAIAVMTPSLRSATNAIYQP